MNYAIVIHKDKRSDYGVTVPDLPGCFSAGKTLDEAMLMAREAIELHLEGLVDQGEEIPPAGEIEIHQRHPDFAGGTWAVVNIDPADLRVRTRRLNVTIPERVVDAMDHFARRTGETRSSLLVQAVVAYIGRENDPALHPAKLGRKPRARVRDEKGQRKPSFPSGKHKSGHD